MTDIAALPATVPPTVDIDRVWKSVQPILFHPDQRVLVASSSGAVIWLSGHEQKLIGSSLRSEVELNFALRGYIRESDALSMQIWRTLIAAQSKPVESVPRQAIYVTLGNLRYLATSQAAYDGTATSVLTIMTPETDSANPNNFDYENAKASARRYDAEWNSYVSSVQNTIYSERAHETGDANAAFNKVSPSEMMEFIPSMKGPDLQFYYSMLGKASSTTGLYGVDGSSENGAQMAAAAAAAVLVPHTGQIIYDPDRVLPENKGFEFAAQVPLMPLKSISRPISRPVNGLMAQDSQNSQAKVVGDKKCLECGVEKSPEWRKGPNGPKTLCNACGLRYAKRLRGLA